MKNTTWFITGGSKGLGLHLAKRLVATGAQVAVTSRSKKSLVEKLGDTVLPLEVDLLDESSVRAAVEETIARFGGLDVVVNNAGYGQMGAVEEVSDTEARANFDVNIFGLLNVLRATLPHLRAQRSGHVFNIGSIGGLTGNFTGFGIYCATKFAVTGLTEGLHADLTALGVKVTCVHPGYFRTEFLASGSAALPANQIADYEAAQGVMNAHLTDINGTQPGDPDKLADALIMVSEMSDPPLHLVLGGDALGLAVSKAEELHAAFEAHRSLSVSTNFSA
jgi:NAD(P)-dependent dehydrogenase (short-subunit alcohol dehydrogenase family)